MIMGHFYHNHKQTFWRIATLLLIGLLATIILLISESLPQPPRRIIVIGKTAGRDVSFWLNIDQGIQTAAREYGTLCEYRSPATEADVDFQIRLVYQAIAEKPDAIILAALDADRLATPARDIRASGIDLVILDSNVNNAGGPIGSSFVATDNVAAGEKAGAEMARLLPAGMTVAIVTPSIQGNSVNDRDTGVRHGLGNQLNVLPTIDCYGSGELAYQKVLVLLAKNPDIGGIVCLNEYTAAGVARAISQAKLTGQVKLVGFDSSAELVNDLEQGLLQATVIQRPFNMGYLAVVKTIDLINGRSIDPFYDTGSILITRDTIYTEENEKLLFPFE